MPSSADPCDVAALRNLALYDPRVDAQVDTMLAMVCGRFMPPEDAGNFLDRELGITKAAVTALRYQGFGCPGLTRVETRDGRVAERGYTEFWGTHEEHVVLPFRYKITPMASVRRPTSPFPIPGRRFTRPGTRKPTIWAPTPSSFAPPAGRIWSKACR